MLLLPPFFKSVMLCNYDKSGNCYEHTKAGCRGCKVGKLKKKSRLLGLCSESRKVNKSKKGAGRLTTNEAEIISRQVDRTNEANE